MDQSLLKSIWSQFGASVDMLENAINLCPEEYWDTDKKFWYNAYHCLFWLDYYLSLNPKEFTPPAPFTLSEFESGGKLPDRTYSKDELLSYLEMSRQKSFKLISGLTDEIANARWINSSKNYSVLEILIYNMRHVQHHAAQLNMILRQEIDDSPKWVSQTKMKFK